MQLSVKTKCLVIVVTLTTFSIQPIYCAEPTMPEPYRSINVLPFDSHGWFRPINQQMLEKFIRQNQPKVVVEVGSWLGSSARFMASILPKEGKLYAVDHWKGQSYYTNPSKEIADRLPIAYEQFLSNIIHLNLTHKVIPIKMSSMEAVQFFDKKADLIYIDGSHIEQDVYDDITKWFHKLTPDGVLCGDDWSALKQVKNGVIRASVYLNQHLVILLKIPLGY